MASWWGKLSSKDVKKKTTKENFMNTLQKLISPIEQKSNVKTKGGRKRNNDTVSEIGCRSRAESRSTSPSTQVSRCQSFADRSLSQPLPLPGKRSSITCTASEVSTSKAILEKRGKSPLLLPLPKPNRSVKAPYTSDIDGDLAITSVSSNCSIDSDDIAYSQLHSPVGNEFDSSSRSIANSHLSALHKDTSSTTCKNLRETTKPRHKVLENQSLSTSPKHDVRNNYQSSTQIHLHAALGSAPDSSMSSPSRSPIAVVYPEQIPTSALWAAKPYPDVTFLGSGQCSSPGSGQTSGHNSLGGDMLGQLWQQSRGSPECSPIPSPRMTSPGPSSRIHSGAVSPLHPHAGGTAPESPTSRHDGGKKQSHKLPLPPINISSNSPFGQNGPTANSSPSIPRSPGRTDIPSHPTSPGSRWKKGKMIGRGTFGHVYVGFNSESGEMCAMKEVTLFMDDAKSKESAKHLGQEISLLSRLRHPNIVQYYGCEMYAALVVFGWHTF